MKKLLSPLVITVGLIAGPVATANHIDFLSDAGFSLSADEADPTPSMNISSGASGNIIGAEREVSLWADVGGYTAELGVPAGPGAVGPNTAVILNVTPNDTTSFGTMRLIYNGQGNAGLGGLDFDTMWDSLDVNFDSISGGQLDLRLSVSDTNGNTGMAAMGALGSAGTYSFPFTHSEFVNAGVNFSSVESITFDFETIDPGVGFGIAGITREAIPEPSSTLLLGLSMIGLIARRRR